MASTCRTCRRLVSPGAPNACTCPDGPLWALLDQKRAQDAARAKTRVASQTPGVDLSSLLLSPAAKRELGGARFPAPSPPSRPPAVEVSFDLDDDLNISFDSGYDLDDIPRAPISQRNRFRVDAPPRHEPFEARTTGPDYEMVREGLRGPVRPTMSRAEAVRAIPASTTPTYAGPRMSAYEHIQTEAIRDPHDPFS